MDRAWSDRAAGVLLGQACGDALGVPYEFGPTLPASFTPQMIGGGPFRFAPAEYSDDTSMAVCIGEVAATGADLTTAAALDEVAQRFLDWSAVSKDVGSQTRSVFAATRQSDGPVGARMLTASQDHALALPGHVGNGALMRTSIVALSRLDDRDATAASARAVASLTHADPLGQESCVLWSEAIRVAVTTGELDLLGGLDLISESRRNQWRAWIDEATDVDPRTFGRNGFTVWALQAAWAAIIWTPIPTRDPSAGTYPAQHFELALMNAVRAGDDTDTVAAIAGGLLGALWGWSAIPAHWSRRVHGYGGHRARGLVTLAVLTASQGQADERGWPLGHHVDYRRNSGALRVAHPQDSGVFLGTYSRLGDHGCDAVTSLCRVGTSDLIQAGALEENHIEIRLLDSEIAADNPHLEFVLGDAAKTIRALRNEGKRVFVHCAHAEQRTPAVAVAYARLLGVGPEQAQADVLAALPDARGRGRLWDAAASQLSG